MGVKFKTPLEKYLSLPEKYPAELIGGEIVMTPSPSFKHQRVAGEIFFQIKNFKDRKNSPGEVLYEFDVHLNDENIVRPDIVYTSSVEKIKDSWIEGAPDLIVEVLSPSTATRDLIVKKELYEKHGVKEYWIVDPENEEIFVFLNIENRFVLSCRGKSCSSEVLKGFKWGFEG